MSDPKLLQRVRQKVRFLHYSIRTENAYIYWIVKFIRFHNLKHPESLSAQDVQVFLNDLANRVHVASSTQNQSFSFFPENLSAEKASSVFTL